ETTFDHAQQHYLSVPPPPLRLKPSPESSIRPVSHVKAQPRFLSNVDLPLLSNEPPFFRYGFGYGATSDTSSSASSSYGDWADNTRPTVWRSVIDKSFRVALSSSGASNYAPLPKVPSVVQSFDSRTTDTQEVFLPVAKRARTDSHRSDDFASCDGQRFSSPSQTPPALSPAAWSSASPTPTSATFPKRSRAYGRQDWQTHAMREADGSWRCIWAEDELTCTYKSKKQATKRHIELKHMKMK
ncbi:hypothetical protein C0992_000438, partial [Termitomyces sp. T32_za158]